VLGQLSPPAATVRARSGRKETQAGREAVGPRSTQRAVPCQNRAVDVRPHRTREPRALGRARCARAAGERIRYHRRVQIRSSRVASGRWGARGGRVRPGAEGGGGLQGDGVTESFELADETLGLLLGAVAALVPVGTEVAVGLASRWCSLRRPHGARTTGLPLQSGQRACACNAPSAESTADEAQHTVTFVDEHGWDHITVATSRHHTARAG
jgi:hypothetical protein